MTVSKSNAGTVVLTINGGSSSIKFALFQTGEVPARLSSGKIERIGLPGSTMAVLDREGTDPKVRSIEAPDHASCVVPLREWLEGQIDISQLHAIGHRVVHGGFKHHQPEQVTPELLQDLRELSQFDPEHLPAEIILIESFERCHPGKMQIACFDTAFHRNLPLVARMLPIPRRYYDKGVRRYGFHGLSYTFLMEELKRVGSPSEYSGRIILAHLGNGASMVAVKNGNPVETTMGFTPASGIPMSQRSGDLDPGLISYLVRLEGMTIEQFHRMVNHESGLLGVSEISSDVRDLLARERNDRRAADAIELFCFQARKAIAALAGTLGGLDTLVFSGGIGENAGVIRERICRGLAFLGITLDKMKNKAGEPVISRANAPVTVRLMRTDEEIEIARTIQRFLE